MRWWNRIRLWSARPRLERELSDEMQAHRDMLRERFVREGIPPDEADLAACRQFGNQASNAEASRSEWGFPSLDSLLRDLRFAARMIVRQPALTTAAVLTVALGVGANTAIVSVLRTVLLNPAGLQNSDSVMVATVRLDNLRMSKAPTSGVEFRELQDMTDVFSAVAAAEGRAWTSEASGQPLRLVGRAVTPEFFRVFGERPAAGRFFVPGDRETAVLSYRMWQAQYGGDPSAIGRVLVLDGQPYRIAGVAPLNFQFPADAQLWTSLTLPPERLRRRGNNMNLGLFVRLRDGVTAAQAADRVNRYVEAIKSPAAEAGQSANAGYFVDLTPFGHYVAGDLRRPLWLLWAAALVVLFTGCANIATLLLSRAAGRRQEMAIRLSIGATRAQILRQLLIESVLTGVLGGAVGIGVAAVAISGLTRVTLPGRELLTLVALDPELILYGLGLSLASGLIFGIAPAVQLLRDNQAAGLARSGRRRFQGVFVAAEVAAALVLVITTGLLLRTLWAIGQIQPGFEPRNVSTAFLLKPKNDPGFIERLDRRLRSIGGVDSAAVAYPLPFSGGGLSSSFSIKGRQRQAGEPEWHGEAYFVSPRYFQSLRIQTVRGRTFADSDTARSPTVCVIDTRLAERFFPGQDPIGQEIGMYRGPARIVGVVSAIRGTTMEEGSRPVVYYPLVQVPFFPQAAVLVRSPGSAASVIREAVRDTNASVALYDVRSMESRIAESLGIRRIMATLVCAFAVICLLLAAVGLNGVVSQLVGERTGEIGIRMALGARPAQILAHFLRYGLGWGALGLLAGLAISVWAQSHLSGLLYSIRPFDPVTFCIASAGIFLAVFMAVWWPARRASRIEPQTALRYE